MMTNYRTQIERLGLNLVDRLFTTAGWIFREQPVADHGVDAQVEACDGQEPTGRLLALQVKAGTSYFKRRGPAGFEFRGTLRHLEYWTQHSLPVILLLVNPHDGMVLWCPIERERIRRHNRSWSVMVPADYVLNESSMAALRRYALPDILRTRRLKALACAPLSVLGIAEMLQLASRTVKVATPFIDDAFMLHLATCANRGVCTRVISTTNCRGHIDQRWQRTSAASLDLRYVHGLHIKTCIIDGDIAAYGSSNLSLMGWSGIERNDLTKDAALLATLDRMFEELWSAGSMC